VIYTSTAPSSPNPMQISESEIIKRVRGFVQENFLYMHTNFQLADDDRLLEKGVMDSMSIVEMISFIESEFGVQAQEEEISEANFGSLSGIARFVGEQRAALAS
jgi:acyl carrier protein